jgi:hypothetical protein
VSETIGVPRVCGGPLGTCCSPLVPVFPTTVFRACDPLVCSLVITNPFVCIWFHTFNHFEPHHYLTLSSMYSESLCIAPR